MILNIGLRVVKYLSGGYIQINNITPKGEKSRDSTYENTVFAKFEAISISILTFKKLYSLRN